MESMVRRHGRRSFPCLSKEERICAHQKFMEEVAFTVSAHNDTSSMDFSHVVFGAFGVNWFFLAGRCTRRTMKKACLVGSYSLLLCDFEDDKSGQIHMSVFFALTYGFGFATIASTLTHVFLFYGREIWQRAVASRSSKPDIHTKLMHKYPDIPQWWFYILLMVLYPLDWDIRSFLCSLYYKSQGQLPWWGLLLACALASLFTLPISVITATTNQTPGLNIITEYIMGYILHGKPIANVCFKVYGYMSMSQAVAFLSDFKLGHYMKIPPRCMFLVQECSLWQ